ncbi:MAG: hypothetical protein JNK85_23115 [Verrucomicrobiales bacterium]|nr:hypothetical protein [Verrucomicrobiales bacterium]
MGIEKEAVGTVKKFHADKSLPMIAEESHPSPKAIIRAALDANRVRMVDQRPDRMAFIMALSCAY